MPRFTVTLSNEAVLAVIGLQRAGRVSEQFAVALAELTRTGIAAKGGDALGMLQRVSRESLESLPAICINTLNTNLENNNTNTSRQDSPEMLQRVSTASPKPKRIKPESLALAEVLARVPMDARAAWYAFASMVAAKNTSGKVAESRLAILLSTILLKCGNCVPAALAHGLLAAARAGADNANYVAKAAAGYVTENAPMQQPAPPKPQLTEEQRAADFAAFCEAQNVPTRAQQQAALDAAAQQAAAASRARQMAAVNTGGEEC